MTETKLDTATQLAYERTRLAYERTMMAWVRTATSMITFGFSVYKFFQVEGPRNEPRAYLVGPYEFGLVLVGLGLLSLLLATIEHRQSMVALRAKAPDMPRSMAMVLAGLVSVLGILALTLMLVRQ